MAGKRKRALDDESGRQTTHIQVVTGSYERVLHGFTISFDAATVINADGAAAQQSKVAFEDTFLFSAHSSSIRCLAVSPASHGKRLLATGGADERINLFHLQSSLQPSTDKGPKSNSTAQHESAKRLHLSSDAHSASAPISTQLRSKTLGSLAHHTTSISHLSFLSHSKLFSAAGDNVLGITRTRDWTLMSSLKAPLPKQHNRPSGDTLGPGEVPSGVNDIAVHPSGRLAISVHRAETCMRLWDLVKGKKAGVLMFDKGLMSSLGESKWRGGEGQRVVWSSSGAQFVVTFDRGAVVFGEDCRAKGIIALGPRSKISQVKYLQREGGEDTVLAVSTEDGKMLFYATGTLSNSDADEEGTTAAPSKALPFAELSVPTNDGTHRRSRIKDFVVLPAPSSTDSKEHVTSSESFFIVTACSDGRVSLLYVSQDELTHAAKSNHTAADNCEDAKEGLAASKSASQADYDVIQAGSCLGTYETSWRITCMDAFVLDEHTEVNGISQKQQVNGDNIEQDGNELSGDGASQSDASAAGVDDDDSDVASSDEHVVVYEAENVGDGSEDEWSGIDET